MSSYFANKVVAITGGTDGIGRALIDALVPLGAKIATCGRNHDKLYNLQMQYANTLLHSEVCDVSNQEDCRKFINSTIEIFGGIDILINNAGISMRGLVNDTDVEVIRKVMDVNFFGSVYCTKFALPTLIARKGTIVGVSSIAGYRGLPGRSGYSASKFALQGWLESLRTELMEKQVNVMWVSPYFTTSNIRNAALDEKGTPTGESLMNEGKMVSAAECAQQILNAIEKHKRAAVFTLMGFTTVLLNRLLPSLTDKMIHKLYFKNGKLIK
jgi:short-subunit dehydrogenase